MREHIQGALRGLGILAAGGVFLFTVGGAPAQDAPMNPFGGGAATTVQLPTFGVAIDADGTLSLKTFADPGGRLRAERLAAAKAGLAADLFRKSELRKVSLRRLEAAVADALRAGKPPDEPLRCLAGLQRAQFVFCYPPTTDEPGDIVLAGPAEGWFADPAGRLVGATTGRPVLLLEDLAVALRVFPPGGRNRPFLGCTIDPDPAALARVQAFQRTIPRSVPQAERDAAALKLGAGMEAALGLANVRLFGVSPRTHFAQVLVEADYRMKLIGIGREPPPVKMATFLGSLQGARPAQLQRWWFTPNYDCVRASDDRLAMELVGQGVQLQTENKVIGPNGQLFAAAGPPGKASEAYAASFTQKYSEIAARAPVYAQLRNLIDLAILAAFLRKHDHYALAEWDAGLLRDEAAFAVETLDTPRQVMCAANAVWKGNRLVLPAGGGVSLVPDDALDDQRLLADEQGAVRKLRAELAHRRPIHWWWD